MNQLFQRNMAFLRRYDPALAGELEAVEPAGVVMRDGLATANGMVISFIMVGIPVPPRLRWWREHPIVCTSISASVLGIYWPPIGPVRTVWS